MNEGRTRCEDYLPAPADQHAIAWRYMDFAKLVSLIQNGPHLSRLDLLGDDQAEGLLHQPQVAFFDQSLKILESVAQKTGISDAPAAARGSWKDSYERMRRGSYVSSWQLSPDETWWMWKVYCKSECGVAVRSTFAKLDSEIPTLSTSMRDVMIGCVRYGDNSSPDPLAIVTSKRNAFRDEHELRILCYLAGAADDSAGFFLGCKADSFAETFVVSPFAPPWFRDVLEATCRALDCFVPVVDSSLRGAPRQPY